VSSRGVSSAAENARKRELFPHVDIRRPSVKGSSIFFGAARRGGAYPLDGTALAEKNALLEVPNDGSLAWQSAGDSSNEQSVPRARNVADPMVATATNTLQQG
jgi:hypothetical protein